MRRVDEWNHATDFTHARHLVFTHTNYVITSAKVNVVNTGGDYEISHSVLQYVVPCTYMMTRNGNDVIALTATLAITFPSLSSEAALPSPSPFPCCRV